MGNELNNTKEALNIFEPANQDGTYSAQNTKN